MPIMSVGKSSLSVAFGHLSLAGYRVTAYGVLGRGLLGGHLKPNLPVDDYRNFSARVRAANKWVYAATPSVA
jgi:hypothetical protein